MFQHFSFSSKTNTSTTRPAVPIAPTMTDGQQQQNNTNTDVARSITPLHFNDNVVIDDNSHPVVVEGSNTPETETMLIVGHKLSYQHETTIMNAEGNLDIPEAPTTLSLHRTNHNNQPKIHDVDDDDDDDDDALSLLSVDLNDLSGSILDDFVPSTSLDNNIISNVLDGSMVEEDDDHDKNNRNVKMTVGNDVVDHGADPNTIFSFGPIVHAMQQSQHEPDAATDPIDHHNDDTENMMKDKIVFLAPKATGTSKVTTPMSRRQMNRRNLARGLALCLSVVLAASSLIYISFPWVTPKYWLKEQQSEKNMDIHHSISGHMSNFTNASQQQQEYLIPVPSPIATTLEPTHDDNSAPLNHVPTFMRIARSFEATIIQITTDDEKDDEDFVVATASSPAGDRISWSIFPKHTIIPPSSSKLDHSMLLFWLPRPIIYFITTIRYIPTCIHRVVSMIIYASTMVVAGCVFVLLLIKFALMTWNKANMPIESTTTMGTNIATSYTPRRVDSRRNITTTLKFTNIETLFEFMQSTQFSRTGRRPRSPAIKSKKDAYNISSYELLSVDDLKCIGKFLQVPKLSKLQQKSNLIHAIVTQYELSLQSLSVSDLKVVLSAMKMNEVETSTKKDLIKNVVEIGF